MSKKKPSSVNDLGYDNLITEVNEVEEYKEGYQPPKPSNKQSDYPFELKVHIWSRKDVDDFCKVIKKSLSYNTRKFTYTSSKEKYPTYTETRSDPFKKRTTHKERIESKLWTDTAQFSNDGWNTYITFEIKFNTQKDLIDFIKKIKVTVSLNLPYISFPPKEPKKWKYWWVCKNKDVQPKYPIYVISKGRADSRLTIKCLERINVPYHVVIEPQDLPLYSFFIDPKKILVLPYSNRGNGPGEARNWCWEHSKKLGYKRHWVMDDNIVDFYRLYNHRKLPIADGGMFRVCEEFVDRFENVPLAGLQYDFFTIANSPYPPFVFNTRIYSVLLIENSCEYRWRGKYNEDTILSLDILKHNSKKPFNINDKTWKGDLCTIQFNCLLQQKSPTQKLKGGNTDEFYAKEGTYNKSRMLEVVHPDVSKVVWRYGRYHHQVNYLPFENNQYKLIKNYNPKDNKSETDLFEFERVKDYFKE